jgi:8-oxo-dGTP pyrophosphatase MutT (NUDIX family)
MNKTSHDSETPAPGQQVISACAFIHHKIDGVEKVFLPKRAVTKKFLPKVYELPGGHIDYGEDIAAGLRREIMEELGMTIEVGDPFFAFTYINEVKGSHSIEVIYFATFVEDPSQVRLDPEDHSESGWFAENELINAATDNKGFDDIEFVAMKKGFALLRGEALMF